MKEWSDFQIGDLVEFAEHNTINKEFFDIGLVIGHVYVSENIKIKSVVVHWNNRIQTNSSPLVLRKL